MLAPPSDNAKHHCLDFVGPAAGGEVIEEPEKQSGTHDYNSGED
jgi:hypothetical protein